MNRTTTTWMALVPMILLGCDGKDGKRQDSTPAGTPVTGTTPSTGGGSGTGTGTGTPTTTTEAPSNCARPLELADPSANVVGDTTDAVDLTSGSCQADGSGPDDVYTFTPSQDGYVSILLADDEPDVDLVVQRVCGDPSTELACSSHQYGQAPGLDWAYVDVDEGVPITVVVSGTDASERGIYTLLAIETHPHACGDSVTSGGEQCDDRNARSGDGCSDLCTIEFNEVEPNGDAGSATPYVEPFVGAIDPTGDVDWVRFTTTTLNTEVTIRSGSPPGVWWSDGQAAAHLELFDTDGTTRLAETRGPLNAIQIREGPLPPGTYYVAVHEDGDDDRMDYRLEIELVEGVCGDGTSSLGEQCDDGNTVSGDGCSDRCLLEAHGWGTCDQGTWTELHSAPGLGLAVTDAAPLTTPAITAPAGTLREVKVRIDDLDHPQLNELELAVYGPAGFGVLLARPALLTGPDFTMTVFDDRCGVDLLQAGAPPFNGCFAPEGRLDLFTGQDAAGPWTLSITDDTAGNDGVLNAWSLGFCQ